MANTQQTGSRAAGETLEEHTRTSPSQSGRQEHDHRPDDVEGRHQLRKSQRRQREEFGGLHWGSAFFGWLVAVGIATLLTALLSAAGAAVGLTETSAGDADTLGIVSGVLLLVILLVAYYAGGYVAGRMSRFAGPRQGLGVWIIGLVVTVILAVAGALLGAEYNVLSQLN